VLVPVTDTLAVDSLPDIVPLVALPDAVPLVANVPPAPSAGPATSPTRRSRRAGQTAEQPVITEPSTPAAPLDTVLIPAEPFELLEPALVESEPVEAELPVASADGAGIPTAEPVIIEAPDAERVVVEPEVAETQDEARAGSSGAEGPTAAEIDAFEAAARLFSFTGETPIQFTARVGDDAADDTPPPVAAHTTVSRNRGASFKRVSAASFSVGVMGIVGLLTVGMTTPADAVAAQRGTDITSSLVASAAAEDAVDEDEIQAYVTPSEVENATIKRDENYSTVTMAQLASESGITNFSNFFKNDPNASIQWPFAVGVPITYGFGMRSGRMHEGVDFTPGAGSPIQAITDGVVRVSTDSGGAYGVHVIVDHVIDGQMVSSHYAHMQYGSRQLQVGDTVTAGTILGRTGNTGRSYGAHTHFELLANGTTAIDPIPWLRQHAGG
jgi:murein DD-endopeptidase MepM/ murein hydrolase activator NlpD